MVICGYCIDSTDLKEIDLAINEIKENCLRVAKIKTSKILVRDIVSLIDDVTRGYLKVDGNILDTTISNMLRHMDYSRQTGALTEYNFNLSLTVFTYENKTYFMFEAPDDSYLKAIRKVKGVIPCHVFEDDDTALKKDCGKSNQEIWEEIKDFYEDRAVMFVRLITNFTDLFKDIDVAKLKFPTKIERAERMARHEVTRMMLQMYAMNGETPAYKTIEELDQCFELMENKKWEDEIKRLAKEYAEKLVDITPESITLNGYSTKKG